MKKNWRRTTWLEKFGASVINVLTVLIIIVPFYLILEMTLFQVKFLFAYLFLVQEVGTLFSPGKRCFGMILMKTYWEKNYLLKNHIIFGVFYFISFLTLIFWVFFPFDLLLFNLLIFQLPTILITGKTLHGLLAGNMCTIKRK